MDPDAALAELRTLAVQLDDSPHDPVGVMRMVELFNGLDSFLSRGGFLPKAWKRPVTAG